MAFFKQISTNYDINMMQFIINYIVAHNYSLIHVKCKDLYFGDVIPKRVYP